MNLLFRLSKDIKGFENIEKTKRYFTETLSKENKNIFYSNQNFNQIDMYQTIYFSYGNNIVATATFVEKIDTSLDRNDSDFNCGHKLENIKIINSELKLNFEKFENFHNMKYIDTEEWQDEINRVINQELIEIYPDDIEDKNLFEGAKKQITVNAYERNSQARKECVEHYGTKCSICDFDFEKKFGDIGKGFIHVHHVKPLSEIDKEYKINPVKDLRPVCPNCHVMLHKKIPAYSIEEIRNFIDQRDL